MAAEPIIQVTNLTRRFDGVTALDDVTFDIRRGEIFGLLGPNGAGKSTMISILATLLPPTSGSATVGGFDTSHQGRHVAEIIGIVPQELALYPTLSGLDNLSFFGRVYGLGGALLRERIREVLEIVGLTERAGDRVEHYSGGMQRRMNLAIGLLHRPQVLFLDEPTVGVDPQSRNHVFESVRRLNRDERMTIIYTTHYMEEAQALCDRVGIIDGGKLVAVDTPRDLIRREGTGIIHIGLNEPRADLAERIAAFPHVERARMEEAGLLEVFTKDAQQALIPIVELINAEGLSLDRLEILEPNLESVFLSLTGRRLRD